MVVVVAAVVQIRRRPVVEVVVVGRWVSVGGADFLSEWTHRSIGGCGGIIGGGGCCAPLHFH